MKTINNFTMNPYRAAGTEHNEMARFTEIGDRSM